MVVDGIGAGVGDGIGAGVGDAFSLSVGAGVGDFIFPSSFLLREEMNNNKLSFNVIKGCCYSNTYMEKKK